MQRVFSAGTFTTEKIRSAIKDVARIHKLSVSTVNYLTKIIDDGTSWTDLMRLAAQDDRIKKFIEKNPEVFEEIRPIMFQPRSAGIHASAVIIVPSEVKQQEVECFDLLPIRKMGDLLASEISGYDIDAIGILKCDILGIQELTRLSDTLKLVEKEYGAHYTILQIASQYLNDPRVFEVLRAGNTQGVFQLGNDGMTKYVKRMRPDNINDLIASVALYRPGPLDSGTAENYVQAKRGEYEPTYLWGTQEILKETFGGMVYQEQLSMVAQKVGSLSLGDGVNLVKALSKKKLEKVRKFKDKFFEGAKANGCPKEAADKIWSDIEDAAKYSFNKCISGKECIMRTNKCQAVSIEEMYKTVHDCAWAKAHNKMPLRSRYLRLGYGIAWSLCSDGKLRKNKIVDIRYEGKRPLYRITLENGKTLDVTENHKHPTLTGTKRTDELLPGVDMMYCYLDRVKMGESGIDTELSKVVSIEYIGDEDVYDVEMMGPLHTFVSGNGVVTCNSHATAYGLTAYVGAWLKVHYPTPFYTVVLRDQDEDKMGVLLNEIRSVGGTEIVKPNINVSGFNFVADYKNNQIYWSLGRIKQLGPNALRAIENERDLFGEFCDLEDFIKRIFRSKLNPSGDKGERNPVTSRSVKNLILAGAFDELERVGSLTERYGLLKRASEMLGFAIDEKKFSEDMLDKHYFWSRLQMEVSGFGQIDYKRIFDNAASDGLKRNKFVELSDLGNMFITYNRGVVCATVLSVTESAYKDRQTGERKKYCKIQLQQNTDTCSLTMWSEAWAENKPLLKQSVGKFLIAPVVIKWSDYEEKNALQINKGATVIIV